MPGTGRRAARPAVEGHRAGPPIRLGRRTAPLTLAALLILTVGTTGRAPATDLPESVPMVSRSGAEFAALCGSAKTVAICDAYIDGIFHGLRVAGRAGGTVTFCLPGPVDLPQLRQTVRTHIAADPQAATGSAVLMVTDALLAAGWILDACDP